MNLVFLRLTSISFDHVSGLALYFHTVLANSPLRNNSNPQKINEFMLIVKHDCNRIK